MTKIHEARISKITYRTDVGRSDAEVLPLGAFLMIDTPRGAMFMLLGKEKLTEEEKVKVDWLSQEALANPIEFFRAAVDEAMTAGADDLLRELANKFPWSIHVSEPTTVALPDEVCRAIEAAVNPKPSASRKRSKAAVGKAKSHKQKKATEIWGGKSALVPPELVELAGPEFRQDEPIAAYTLPPPWMMNSGPAERVHAGC
ncbi:MAG: hypothetical protein WDN69_24970 [Aliidongia sp.]